LRSTAETFPATFAGTPVPRPTPRRFSFSNFLSKERRFQTPDEIAFAFDRFTSSVARITKKKRDVQPVF
jgi:hypothetical protein